MQNTMMLDDKSSYSHEMLNKIEIINATTIAMDFLEKGVREEITNHNRRVAYFAIRIAEKLNLDEAEIVDLFAYSMLHDNGVTYKIYYLSVLDRDYIEKKAAHCVLGEENLKIFPFEKKRDNILLYHHENWDGSGFFNIVGEKIPLFSAIIHLSDMLEIEYRKSDYAKDIVNYVKQNDGKMFSPYLCEIFYKLSEKPEFWLGMSDMFIIKELEKLLPTKVYNISFDQFSDLSQVICSIVDAKSPFTFRHSKGLSEKAEVMADYYGFSEEKKKRFIVAAYLHDIGKLVVSNSILDKPDKLTFDEFEDVKCHTYYTRKILTGIKGIEDICEWASNHHEKLNGSGYPYGLKADEICFESQIMSCMDILQALTEERPYRKPSSRHEVESIFSSMVDRGELSGDIVHDVLEAIDF